MNTTINIQTTTEIKIKAQKIAEKLGMSLNTVLARYLTTFVKTKGADVNEEPSDYLIKSLKESEADVKAGRVISFNSGQEALDYLKKEIEDEKRDTH